MKVQLLVEEEVKLKLNHDEGEDSPIFGPLKSLLQLKEKK